MASGLSKLSKKDPARTTAFENAECRVLPRTLKAARLEADQNIRA